MSEIHVDFGSLQAGAAGIRTNYSKLTGTLEQLESDLAPMVASWSGAAQESYLQCKKQWEDAATALAQVLSNIGSAVEQAHENYVNAENAAQKNWA
jgi:early secretory antigenic target protein ESAT-6